MISLYLHWGQWKGMDNRELILLLKSELSIPANEEDSVEKMRSVLTVYINDLIEKDFQKLVNLLYRLDVNENKLKQMLKVKDSENAGEIIADLIIERQMQKIEMRKRFKQGEQNASEDEKW
jgi:hypothetical protein